jgi:dolichol-phosphate mannosyltransferase
VSGRLPVERPLVVIPTYNEADSLPGVLQRLLAAVPQVEVLVVDDASPDGTGRIADEASATDRRVHVLHRAAKSGLGAAYLAGFSWGLDHGAGALVEMDADGSHAPEELPRLLDRLADADVVLGSRWVPGGEVVDWPRWRELLSRGGNAYTRRMLRLPLGDATGGFRAYRSDALARLDLATVDSEGYCFQIDLARRAVAAGLDVAEVPIRFVERRAGASKMSRAIIAEALWRVTVWGVQERGSRRVKTDRPPADSS